jgi:hypothetical protein
MDTFTKPDYIAKIVNGTASFTREGYEKFRQQNLKQNVQQQEAHQKKTRTNVRCWNCKVKGHYAAGCPLPKQKKR